MEFLLKLKSIPKGSVINFDLAYFKSNINNNISHPKLLWKNLKSTLLPQKCCAELPTHLKDPDRINSHFLNVPGDEITSLSTCTYYEFHRFSDCVFTLKTMDETKILKLYRTPSSSANVLLRGQIIERVSEARNLGLLMDEGLRFESHISNCVRNCFYRLKQLAIPQHRSAAFRGSFRYAASKCWNNIPPPIRNLQSTYSFRRRLKDFLISSQIDSESINIDMSFI
ncbi:hypothetical protein SFRURICE_008667 [Spodoptera frugiperda]|nr:hypothetical protein SFRURICE_008667 [Spodoptera frugiperda]